MMLRGVRVVSDDQECLVNFSMSGCFDIYMFSPMRFSVSIPWFNGFWSFPRYAGPFFIPPPKSFVHRSNVSC